VEAGASENTTFSSTLRPCLRAAVGDAWSVEPATRVTHLTARRSTAARSAIHVFGLPSRRSVASRVLQARTLALDLVRVPPRMSILTVASVPTCPEREGAFVAVPVHAVRRRDLLELARRLVPRPNVRVEAGPTVLCLAREAHHVPRRLAGQAQRRWASPRTRG
jgi:hypothetical protein